MYCHPFQIGDSRRSRPATQKEVMGAFKLLNTPWLRIDLKPGAVLQKQVRVSIVTIITCDFVKNSMICCKNNHEYTNSFLRMCLLLQPNYSSNNILTANSQTLILATPPSNFTNPIPLYFLVLHPFHTKYWFHYIYHSYITSTLNGRTDTIFSDSNKTWCLL